MNLSSKTSLFNFIDCGSKIDHKNSTATSGKVHQGHMIFEDDGGCYWDYKGMQWWKNLISTKNHSETYKIIVIII